VAFIDRGRRELDRGPHVFRCQLRVLRNDAVSGEAVGDEADDRGDRDARARYARHATHDSVIGHHSSGFHEDSVAPARVATIEFVLGYRR
jgi:hypothetical protein